MCKLWLYQKYEMQQLVPLCSQDGERPPVTKIQADQIRIGATGTSGPDSYRDDDPFEDGSPNPLFNAGPQLWQ